MEKLDKLEKSPLFRLSLASKELFHSNFIEWYGDTYPNLLGEILKEWINCSEKLTVDKIEREKANIDLTIHCKKGGNKITIVIENKVKSIPTNEQLEKYSKKNPADYFVLLTFIEPEEDLPDKWILIGYNKFLNQIKRDTSDPYHSELISDYQGFTCSLYEILQSLLKSNNFFLDNDIEERLRTLRIHDIAGKAQVFSAFQTLSKEYQTSQLKTIGPQKESDGLFIEHGFLKGTPILGISYSFKGSGETRYGVGVQLDGNELRIFGSAPCTGKKDPRAEKFMSYLCKNIWNNCPDFSGPLPNRKRKNAYHKDFLQYQAKKSGQLFEIFLYLRKKLKTGDKKEFSREKLISTIKNLFDPVLESKTDIQAEIDEISSSPGKR